MSSKFLDKTGLDTLWAKIKSTFQTLGNLVTAWGSTPSDTKYPSEKLVKDSLDGKLPKTTKASEIISSAYPQCFYSTSYYYGGYVLFYDVTSAFDGTFTSITSDQAHVAFSGFVQSAKYNGYGEPQFFKVKGKVNGKYPTNYNASTSKTYGPVVLKRTYEEDGVTKERYYFAIKVPANYNHGMMFFGVFHKYGLSGTALSWDSGFLGNLVLSTDTEYSVHWSWTAGYNVAAEAGTADKAKAFDSTFTGTDSIKSALDGKVPGTALSVSVPANSTRYVKMVVPNGYHHYLVFFNASQGVLHAEWLFRSYGDGGTARTTVNYIGALVTARRWYVAGASGNTFYIEFVNNSTGSQSLNFKVCALDISALPTLTVESEVPSGYVQQSVVGTVASQLLTARNLAVSLSNTSTDTPFDGHAAVTNIKTTGTLGIENGGTGATTAIGAEYNILNQVADIDTTINGDRKIALCNQTKSASNGVFRWLKLSNVWTWIKGLLSSESGVNISGNAATATTAAGYTSGGAIDTALQGKATPADITSAIQALDVASQGGDGKYIKAISETDGKVSATAETMDTAPTANSTKAVTSGGVKTALDGKQDDLGISSSGDAGKFLNEQGSWQVPVAERSDGHSVWYRNSSWNVGQLLNQYVGKSTTWDNTDSYDLTTLKAGDTIKIYVTVTNMANAHFVMDLKVTAVGSVAPTATVMAIYQADQNEVLDGTDADANNFVIPGNYILQRVKQVSNNWPGTTSGSLDYTNLCVTRLVRNDSSSTYNDTQNIQQSVRWGARQLYRTKINGTWGSWRAVPMCNGNYYTATGSATKPVYVNAADSVTECNIEFVVNDSSIGNRIVFY